MSDEALRTMLAKAVAHLRGETDLTMDEVIGLKAPNPSWSPETRHALGIIEGAAAALRATPRELLEDHELLTAPRS